MLIPAWGVAGLTVVNVVVLGVWFNRRRNWAAIALMIPMLYLCGLYILIDTFEPTKAQLYGRDGFSFLLSCEALVFAKIAGLLGGNGNGH